MEELLKEIKISLPADILLSANINQEDMVQEMRETLALTFRTPFEQVRKVSRNDGMKVFYGGDSYEEAQKNQISP